MSNSKSWVKFKRAHPKYAYFVGDVVEMKDSVLEGFGDEKGLNELGYTIPAKKEEIAAAKLAAENPRSRQTSRTDDAMVGIIDAQQQKIDELTQKLAELISASGEKVDPAAPPVAPPVAPGK